MSKIHIDIDLIVQKYNSGESARQIAKGRVVYNISISSKRD